jgi:hypothetical protein
MLATRTKKRPEIAGLNPLPRMTPNTLRRTYISIMLPLSGQPLGHSMPRDTDVAHRRSR